MRVAVAINGGHIDGLSMAEAEAAALLLETEGKAMPQTEWDDLVENVLPYKTPAWDGAYPVFEIANWKVTA